VKLNDKGETTRVGGVKYTIKDGIVYDARKLLADVRRMVREAKAAAAAKEAKEAQDAAAPGAKDPPGGILPPGAG
jgi:hypothetical protein